jgi:pectinesterase
VALYADADRLFFTDCSFISHQDTICTGPLPKNPIPMGLNLLHPVAGLGADIPALPFRQHFRACLVAGDVDFIFGSALAGFEDCELRSRARGGEPTYIAAPSTYPGQEAGFVFSCCRLTAEEGEHGSVYLGRPWRPTGRCVYLKCELGAHIDSAGWDDWGKPEAHDQGFFGEFRSTGIGAADTERPAWVRILRAGEAARFSPGRLLIGGTSTGNRV